MDCAIFQARSDIPEWAGESARRMLDDAPGCKRLNSVTVPSYATANAVVGATENGFRAMPGSRLHSESLSETVDSRPVDPAVRPN